MFAFLAEQVEQAQETAEHVPILVRLVNQYFGEYAYNFEMKYTYPFWKKLLARFGSTPEAAFGVYTPENAIPWYTVMFVIACILSLIVIWILRGKLSEDQPGHGQQTLEVGVLSVRSMLEDIVGPHGLQYFPVVMTFAVLILVSNLMGFFPLFISPTSATSVTFALGLASFLYYNYIGIKENGIFGHLKHFAGV
jgi:F-type H+-transporting ATPase subunit a